MRYASRQARLRPSLFRVPSLFVLFCLLMAPTWVAAQATGSVPAPSEEQAKNMPKIPTDLSKPPDGKWLVDDQGREYFTFLLPKKGVRWVRVDEDTIRISRGPHFNFMSEDEEYFTIKILNRLSIQVANDVSEPTPEELAQAAATYDVTIGSEDGRQFEPFDEGLPRNGLWRNGFDLADMNDDGFLDIVHGPPRRSPGAPPVIFLGDGQGGWTYWREVVYPSMRYDYGDAAAGDFDGDGRQDLAIGIHARGIVALRNTGEGQFELWSDGIEFEGVNHKGKPAFSTRELLTHDWDGDGRLDIVAFAEGARGFEHVGKRGGNGLVFYRNLGAGKWEKQADFGSPVFGDKMLTADVDGDGRLEIVTSTNYAGQRGLINAWKGDSDPAWQRQAIDLLRPNALVWSIAKADFDRDGRDDIVVGYRGRELGVIRTGIDVLFPRGDEPWRRLPILVFNESSEDGSVLAENIHAMAAADFDGDGKADVVASSREGRLYAFFGDGKGSFIRELEPELEAARPACRGYHIAAADLDGQPGQEIVASFAGENCKPSGGSLRAWKVTRRASAEPASNASE